MVEKIIIIALLCLASSAGAETWNEQQLRANSGQAAMRRACPAKDQETWKETENRIACEERFKLRYYDSTPQQSTRSTRDPGHCAGDCSIEQGICIGECGNNDRCISNCYSAAGRCFSRCN